MQPAIPCPQLCFRPYCIDFRRKIQALRQKNFVRKAACFLKVHLQTALFRRGQIITWQTAHIGPGASGLYAARA